MLCYVLEANNNGVIVDALDGRFVAEFVTWEGVKPVQLEQKVFDALELSPIKKGAITDYQFDSIISNSIRYDVKYNELSSEIHSIAINQGIDTIMAFVWNIKYLHEFQNLYELLCKKEFKLNINKLLENEI
jgi:hypothetical protein